MNPNLDLSKETGENMITLCRIQDLLLNIDSDTISQFESVLLSNDILSRKDMFDALLTSLNFIIMARPNKIDLLLTILSKLKPKIFEHFTQDEIIKLFLFNEVALFNLGIVSDDLSNYDNYPETFLRPLDAYSSRDLSEKEIEKSIRNDDVCEFQVLLSNSNKDINSLVNCPSTNANEFILDKDEHSYIEYAALYGSLNVFKFLWLQEGIEINNNLSVYAIAGGNYDIIHMLDDKMNEDCIIAAIRFFHHDLLEYLFNIVYHNDFSKSKFEETNQENTNLDTKVNQDKERGNNNIRKKINLLLETCIQCFNLNNLARFHFISMREVFIAVDFDYVFILKYFNDVLNYDITQKRQYNNILYEAASIGNVKILNFILNERQLFDVNSRNEELMTALHFAVIGRRIFHVKFLLTIPNIDINAADKDESTPLHWAVAANDFEIFKLLAQNSNTNLKAVNKLKQNILHISMNCIDNDILKYILDNKMVNVFSKDSSDENLIHYAARTGMDWIFSHPTISNLPNRFFNLQNSFFRFI